MRTRYIIALCLLISQITFGAELFIRVNRPGNHSATAYNQTQSNTTNIFRFFELPGGNINVQITDQQTGYSIYNGFVNLAANQRVVAELDNNGVLQYIQNCTITPVNWYTPSTGCGNGNQGYPGNNNGYPNNNNGYPNNNNGYPNNNNGYPNNGYPGNNNVNNDQAFQQLLKILADEPFDSNRMDVAKGYANRTMMSAQQIADISTKFTFDNSRLDWAKYAYHKCYDKANYFLLKSTFTYSSNYSALEKYIEGQ